MWRQTAFVRFKDYSLNKKQIKKSASKTKQPSVPAYAGRAAVNMSGDEFSIGLSCHSGLQSPIRNTLQLYMVIIFF